MKTTTNRGVAAAWVNGIEAKSNNGNMSTNGCGTLYSYSTPIGIIKRGVDGKPVYLITAHDYSVTTKGKHIGPAHRATNYAAHVVPFFGIGRVGRHSPDTLDMAEAHAGNVAYLVGRYVDDREGMKAKRSFGQFNEEHLMRLAANARAYALAFGLPLPAIDHMTDIVALRGYHEAKAERAAKRRPSATILPFQRRA
jgi:hypothetical protein